MADVHEHKFLKKGLGTGWRSKFSKAADHPEAPKKPPPPPANTDDDLNSFLAPSRDRAKSNQEAAAAAILANKPRIDVARAQRWPAASDVINSAASKTPGAGGLKTGTRKKGLTVSFVRTQPIVIGEGGDECEEPSIEVFRRRKSHSLTGLDTLPTQTHQDDMNIGTRTATALSPTSVEAQRRIVARTNTSHGEISPPLQQKMEYGRINTHAAPAPPPSRGLGPMGLGERPRGLQRAPTGFDLGNEQQTGVVRPSMDSTRSYDSDDISPVLSMKAPSLPPTVQEEDDFRPKSLQRTATGWSEHQQDSSDDEPPPLMPQFPRLPELDLKDDNSPLDSTTNHFLQSEPGDPNSFSARVQQKMRQDEGKVLHEAALRRQTSGSNRNSASSGDSFQPSSQQSSQFLVGTPPTQLNALAGKTPPRFPGRDPLHSPESPGTLVAEDPHRSRVRGPSPGRSPMPPGTFPIDTNQRPLSSSSSQYVSSGGASRSLGSPTGYTAAPPHKPIQPVAETMLALRKAPSPPTPPEQELDPVSAISQTSIVPTPPQFERSEYVQPHEQPPLPPPHTQYPTASSSIQRRPTAREVSQAQSRAPPSGATNALGRSDTKSQAEFAFADFSERVTHMKGIFTLMAQLRGQIYDHTPILWLRVAMWWFLRGRVGMESIIRNRPKTGEPQPERLTQPHVDLAKTWWILTEIIQNHPNLRRYGDQRLENQARFAREANDIGSAEVYEAHDVLLASLKMLLGSMKRHQSMPPTQALIQGQDQSIWVEYPTFAPDVHSVLSGTASRSAFASGPIQLNPTVCMPLNDTKANFCYFRMFVNVSLSTDDPNTDRVPLPAIISVLRPRDDFKVKLSICSQSELINVAVQAHPDQGPTWRDVTWKSKTCGMSIQLKHGFNLNVELSEPDFRNLWAIVDHTNRVESNLRERGDERMFTKLYLRDFAYKDSTNPGAFPPERVKSCKLLVFEKFDRSSEGTGKRKLHRGFRIVVVTNTQTRTLSCVNHEMGTKQEPMNFEYTKDPADGAPGMTLRFKEEIPGGKLRLCKMEMFFNESQDRNHLFGTFTSMNQGPDEAVFAQVPLKAFSIESADQAEGFSQSGRDVLKRLQWMETKVLNQDPDVVGLESAPTVMSESLRIVCRHGSGIISDRMNLGPGDLLVRLPIDGAAELTLLRNPQQDMAVAIDPSRSDKDIPDALADLLRTLCNASTIRRLTFNSFKDLHTFQLAVTGFQVKFDGIASSLQISRRRAVVPIYKQWTANTIRIQIVEQDNIVQLLAFFEEFSHADAMNFQLKPMDVFEKSDKGGKSSVKLVDAKFALPVEERKGEGKIGKAEGKLSGWAGMKRRFICLDQIEYPGEQDDILISFDGAETRDRFADALPAATMNRKFTVRRKI